MTERNTRRLAADAAGEAQAAEILREGGLVAFPTETVYGLGADATNPRAVAAIYEAKGRPRFNPLIAHVASFERPVAKANSRRSPKNSRKNSGRGRSPSSSPSPRPPASAISPARDCRASACACPRKNRPRPHRACAKTHRRALGQSFRPCQPRDSGPCAGRPRRPHRRRGGRRPLRRRRRIHHRRRARRPPDAAASRRPFTRTHRNGPRRRTRGRRERKNSTPRSPACSPRTTRRRASVRLEAQTLEPGEAGLDFAGRFSAGNILDLSPTGDLAEAAANLFSHLRVLDASGATRIAVAPIPRHGLGEAINDRLSRAAAPRP